MTASEYTVPFGRDTLPFRLPPTMRGAVAESRDVLVVPHALLTLPALQPAPALT